MNEETKLRQARWEKMEQTIIFKNAYHFEEKKYDKILNNMPKSYITS